MAYTFFEVQVEGQKVESRNSFIRIPKKQPILAESVRETRTHVMKLNSKSEKIIAKLFPPLTHQSKNVGKKRCEYAWAPHINLCCLPCVMHWCWYVFTTLLTKRAWHGYESITNFNLAVTNERKPRDYDVCQKCSRDACALDLGWYMSHGRPSSTLSQKISHLHVYISKHLNHNVRTLPSNLFWFVWMKAPMAITIHFFT
jgi:hypothetical protein